MNTLHRRLLGLVKGLLTRALLEKLQPRIAAERKQLDEGRLAQAVAGVQRKVGQMIDDLRVFDADLILAKVPSLEFLEFLVLVEYLHLQAAAGLSIAGRGDSLELDPGLLAALRKILGAYGVHTPEQWETYRGIWSESWGTVGQKPRDADTIFEQIKAAFKEAA